MRKSINDCSVDKVIGLKNGQGLTTVINFFEKENFHGKGRLYGISIIEPNGSIGIHTHTGDQEAYFILEGKGLYNDDGDEYEINPGDFLICEDGHSHGLKNIGDVDLRYVALIIYTK